MSKYIIPEEKPIYEVYDSKNKLIASWDPIEFLNKFLAISKDKTEDEQNILLPEFLKNNYEGLKDLSETQLVFLFKNFSSYVEDLKKNIDKESIQK